MRKPAMVALVALVQSACVAPRVAGSDRGEVPPSDAQPLPGEAPAASPPVAPPGAKLTSGRVAICDLRAATDDLSADEVRRVADRVRADAAKAAPQLEVMGSAANSGGPCEVGSGRRIGADAIVDGEVRKLGSRYRVTLRLHETQNGKLLGAAVASARSIDELDQAITRAVSDLFGGNGP